MALSIRGSGLYFYYFSLNNMKTKLNEWGSLLTILHVPRSFFSPWPSEGDARNIALCWQHATKLLLDKFPNKKGLLWFILQHQNLIFLIKYKNDFVPWHPRSEATNGVITPLLLISFIVACAYVARLLLTTKNDCHFPSTDHPIFNHLNYIKRFVLSH